MEVEKGKMGLEETELRLGLGHGHGLRGKGNNDSVDEGAEGPRKRGFSETLDLKLNLSYKETSGGTGPNDHNQSYVLAKEKTLIAADPAEPPAKSQVVGWPPVRSFRKNMLAEKKSRSDEESEKPASATSGNATFVKVSMEGAPYLRKVDLKKYKSYKELSDALAKMFSSFTIGNCGAPGMKDFVNVSKPVDLLNGTDYLPTYEDKDGDWMLFGDVPWEMFIGSCKRLRIMKGREATGLAPRAMEKCKNRG